MKAERRHELKENTLAKNLEHAPAFLQQYGSRILLGFTLCLLAFILWRNHSASVAQRAAQTSEDMGSALYSLDLLRNLPPGAPVDQLAKTRHDLARDVEDALTRVLNDSEDSKLRAQALVARGDLNWQLANFPTLPTTNPDLAPTRGSDDLLKASEDAYKQVLQSPEDGNHEAVISARFGLAAIAENRQQWDAAKQYYQQIIDDKSAAKEFTELAKSRMDADSTTLSKPVIVGTPIPPAPKSLPPTTRPVLGPSLPSDFSPPQTPSIGLPSETPSVVPPNPFGSAPPAKK